MGAAGGGLSRDAARMSCSMANPAAAAQNSAETTKPGAAQTRPCHAGVPHRIGYLAKMLDLLQIRDDTVFMTGGRIADWFVAADEASQAS